MITVVSGLPRSGTSLMMQMLEAGGMAVLSDGRRLPDDDNPRGYYELEKVTRLKEDSAWLAEAEGKALKVVSPLLYDLPASLRYRVLFMERRLDEILASQRTMLEHRKADVGPVEDAQMAAHFERHLDRLKRWLPTASHLEVLFCDHGELLRNPALTAERAARFLERELDVGRMAMAVDPELHRNRR
jgi:hypothetical protein